MIERMKSYQPSDTYKLLFNHIIGELLEQICSQSQNYCVQNDKIPFLIGEKFEEYKSRALKNMSGKRLDRHKLASCICGAKNVFNTIFGHMQKFFIIWSCTIKSILMTFIRSIFKTSKTKSRESSELLFCSFVFFETKHN